MSGRSKSLISIVVFMLENWVQHCFWRLRFRLSTQKRSVFKSLRFQRRFRKSPFLVETTPPNHRLLVDRRLKRIKSMRFRRKTHKFGRGLYVRYLLRMDALSWLFLVFIRVAAQFNLSTHKTSTHLYSGLW